MAATASGNAEPFVFPREYSFPAFFTRQANLTTHHAQLTKWSALVLSYTRHHRIFRLTVSSAAESDLFCNRRLDRRLQIPDIRELLEFMRKDGRAEYVSSSSSSSSFPSGGGGDPSSSSSGGGGGREGGSGGGGDVVLIYWRRPSEWAHIIESFIESTAQKGSVLTLYELAEGEATRSTELHGIDGDVLLKALNVLVKKGKAQIFGHDDSQGVKFF
ncbi:ESCRT-II complex subunit VPS25 [Geosmithia morbida]|uniref:Vacuolar protein-sorting-associated protein 25 n=1 Tax=Geosmithia morbida TaxID=1094350 RepID=A0A9P5D7A5_9HYPO|nr:ESCRT-II complex subunit VPS25 [Geosmithia morbida]KAF4125600.1 ESCRT-II complex subunit VPS25 [Geosmithia morbida]